MRRLNKKVWRDIWFNKSQFVNIFIMVFLGVFVFSGIHAYMDGMKFSSEKYYDENNLQDLWLAGENFTKEDLKNIKNIDNIKNAERAFSIRTELQDYQDVVLETNFLESNDISRMEIIDGETFSQIKTGLWLDNYLAKSLNLKVGDELTLKYKGYEIKEKINGLVESPDHVYFIKDETAIFPTHTDFGYCYLSINEFPKEYIYDNIKSDIIKQNPMAEKLFENSADTKEAIIKDLIPDFKIEDYYVFNEAFVDVDNTEKIQETKSNIENNIESAIAVTDRESNVSYKGYNSEIEEGQTYSKVFTFLFLFIALLSVVTTMNRFVKKQRTQIGTMKALGIKKRKITKHYIKFGFYLSLIAAFLGTIVGALVIGNAFLNMEMSYFEVPKYSITIVPEVYILAGSVVVLVTLVTYLSCRKILKEPASKALRIEMPKVKSTRFDFSNGIFKKATISTKWNLRDIIRNKGRSLMAIVGIIGCTMLIVCAFGMLDTMNSYLDWEFNTISNFEYKLNLATNYTEEQYSNLILKYGEKTSQTLAIEFKNEENKQASTVTINDAKDYLNVTGHNREKIDLKDDGVFITEKMAKKYNLNIGDEINWHIFGDDNWYKTKIVGLNRDPQSQTITANRKFIESIGIKYKADAIYTNQDLKDIEEIEGVETIQSKQNLEDGMRSMLETTKSVIVLLIVVSAILGFVIIYNLGILSFSEKQYQFATLKVLGFKDKTIKNIFIKQNVWLSIVGITIGLPLGFIMLDYIFREALGDNYDFSAKIKWISYIYSIFGSFIVTIVVNKVLAKKVKTIDMVTSLKANE